MKANNYFKFIICILFLLGMSGCTYNESRPSYEPLENIIVSGVKTMQWSEGEGLLNVGELEGELSEKEKKVFLHSLEWLATESSISFSLLKNKTAAQIVSIANCLKTNIGKSNDSCISQWSMHNQAVQLGTESSSF